MLFDLAFSLQNLSRIKKKKKKKNSPVPRKLVRSFLSTTKAFKKEKVFDNPVNNVTIKLLKTGAGWQQFIPRQGLQSRGPVCRRYQLLENPERSFEECLSPPQDSPSSPRTVEPQRNRSLTTALQRGQNSTFFVWSKPQWWPIPGTTALELHFPPC